MNIYDTSDPILIKILQDLNILKMKYLDGLNYLDQLKDYVETSLSMRQNVIESSVIQKVEQEESENKGHFLESQDDSSNYHEDVALIEPEVEIEENDETEFGDEQSGGEFGMIDIKEELYVESDSHEVPLKTRKSAKRIKHDKNDENTYSCEHCEKTFSKYGSLVQHRRIHTGEFRCEYCHKSFGQRVHLVAHRRTHTGERPFECELCAKTFTEKQSLTRHIRNAH